MKNIILVLILICLIACDQEDAPILLQNGVLIKNATIISVNDKGMVESYKGSVVTENNLIIYCGSMEPKVEGNFELIQGEGKFVIPGLIDSHVHLNNIAGLNFRQRANYEELVRSYFQRLPKNFLYYGYTSLIDVDNYAPEIVARLAKDSIGPEIYTCGQKIQVMNDFEMVINEMSPEARMQMPFLHDKYNKKVQFPDSIDLSNHDPEILVRNLKSTGNICIKTLYEDASSGLPLLWEIPSDEILVELVTEAHKNDMKVVLHAPSFEGQRIAYESNVDVIAHALWNWTSEPEKYLDSNLPDSHRKLLVAIANKGIGYQPTFRTIMGETDILKDQFIEEHDLEDLYTEEYLAYLKSDDAEWSKKRILGRTEFLSKINPDFYHPIRNKFSSDQAFFDGLYESFWLKMQQVIQILVKNNANLLFSTDNGAMNMYTHPPGLNGYLEMQHWVDAGVPFDMLFKAVTYNNAKTFDLLDQIGTLKEGKKANILILNSNPLKSVGAYNEIDLIINGGKIIHRKDLKAY